MKGTVQKNCPFHSVNDQAPCFIMTKNGSACMPTTLKAYKQTYFKLELHFKKLCTRTTKTADKVKLFQPFFIYCFKEGRLNPFALGKAYNAI